MSGTPTRRLVEGQVDQVLAGWDALAVDPDDLVLGIDPGAEPADGLPVDLDPPLPDQFLPVPAGADPRGGQHLLQPDAAGDIGQAVALAELIAPVVVVIVVEAEIAGTHVPVTRVHAGFPARGPASPSPA